MQLASANGLNDSVQHNGLAENGTSPYRGHPMDVEQFRKEAKNMVDFVCDYYNNVEGMPVRSSVEPGYLAKLVPEEAPIEGELLEDIMSDVRQKIMPGITHWQSPYFFGYFPCNSSFPALLGDMLCSGLATQNFSWIGSPAATELEMIVLDWLGKLLHLPPQFLARPPAGTKAAVWGDRALQGGGVIQSTASESTLVALLAARQRATNGATTAYPRLVAYTSDQGHSSVVKACKIAGVSHVRVLEARAEDGWALQASALEAAVQQDLKLELVPFFLFATIGTTSTCAVDPVRELGLVTQSHGLWLHVDAAYAGPLAMLPEMRQHFMGLETVQSFSCNPHKWMLTNFDCSTLWLTDSFSLRSVMSANPAYLQAQANDLDFKDWQIPLGRRFRALKLWFVMRSYGVQGLQGYLRHHLALAKLFEGFVVDSKDFELSAPPSFGLICFRAKGFDNDQQRQLLEAINSSGRAFMVHTEVGGQFMLRFALGSTYVQEKHVENAWRVICDMRMKIAGGKAT